ncbi:MAG TPA: hypothetical protein VLR46_00320 [Candidatus Dormibacteraeota bacterium]|nr:hypothetical protein [Candidatus Dormibacteraeota bacterium]
MTRPSTKRILAAGGALVLLAAVASWVFYFGPDQVPQQWVVVSTGWGHCGTNVQQGVSAVNTCEVRGTFRNDGGTAPNRYVPSSMGAFGDVYSYTALFEPTPTQTCGALLDPKTHHGQSVTVSCAVSQGAAVNTGIPVKVEIRSESHFQRASNP